MTTSASVTWTPGATDGSARAGWLDTPHGKVATPVFMPVGTRGTVKALSGEDLESLGAGVVLANTYHLMLRPGVETIAELGGLHAFMGWPGIILTDSGGFQIFSLSPKVDDQGATFKSVYDGAIVRLTPEEAVQIQQDLGSDIAMVLDVCVALPSPREVVEAQMERTLAWAERCAAVHDLPGQSLFGIVQGGVDPELRVRSALRTAEIGFAGFGIGGLSVGESDDERNLALESAISALPGDRPRYFMGLGDTDGLLDAVARGVDMFDCVLPTRLARHGKVLTAQGDLNIRNARFEADARPLEEGCECPTCQRYSRAYLRHLFRMNEMTGHRLLTLHNVAYTLRLMEGVRGAIMDGIYGDFVGMIREHRMRGSS